jgi:predicted NBD/HSP70 family sugar kinase
MSDPITNFFLREAHGKILEATAPPLTGRGASREFPIKPRIPAPLDPGFQPAILFNRSYVTAARNSGEAVPIVIGLERENGLFSRFETVVKGKADTETLRYVVRLVKFLLWARGGWRIWFGGPTGIGDHLALSFSKIGSRSFDVGLMSQVYGRPFEVTVTAMDDVPAARESAAALGGHLGGCRLGFDLGASDYKVAALRDGETVYSEEFPWNPRDQPDPQYHYERINSALKKAAAHLPRVDAIGGSSAGVIVDNKIMVASLFRSVPKGKFDDAQNMFLRLRREWNVPLEVANDGDVTALAGAMALKANAVLGIAMGSSQAAGYLDPHGRVTGWLSELAFAPVDYNLNAAVDEWSGDYGVGALYFSQLAVNHLLPGAQIEFSKEIGVPERLKLVQERMAAGDPGARKIYETIGVYLGYAIPHYADFYDFKHLLVLGRVTTGCGGDVILEKAREVLAAEFPETAEAVQLHVPDEKDRRVGQAVAAASLPAGNSVWS